MFPRRSDQNFRNSNNPNTVYHRVSGARSLINPEETVAPVSEFNPADYFNSPSTSRAVMNYTGNNMPFFESNFPSPNVAPPRRDFFRGFERSFYPMEPFHAMEEARLATPNHGQRRVNSFLGNEVFQPEVFECFTDNFGSNNCKTSNFEIFQPKISNVTSPAVFQDVEMANVFDTDKSNFNKTISMNVAPQAAFEQKENVNPLNVAPKPSRFATKRPFNNAFNENPRVSKQNENHDHIDKKPKMETKDFVKEKLNDSLRVLTGTVTSVLKWWKLKENFEILFEVVALLVEIKPGAKDLEKVLILKDSQSGPVLRVIFYAIDRPLPSLEVGKPLVCVGRLISRNCLQAFKINQISGEERLQLSKVGCTSIRVAEEMLSRAK